MHAAERDAPQTGAAPPLRLDAGGLQAVIDTLRAQGYTVIAPTLREGVVCLDEIGGVADLPAGVRDEQGPGRYRTTGLADGAYFAHTVGPQAWKRYLQPPLRRLWRARRVDGRFTLEMDGEEPPRLAFFGVRPCDLAAIELLDRIYLRGPYVDPFYAARRAALVIVAANCLYPGGDCFCASLGTGPRAVAGFDLALTEIADGAGGNAGEHTFVVDVGTARGAALLAGAASRPAAGAEIERAAALIDAARRSMGRSLDTDGLHDLLLHNLEHPLWEEVAQRCLTCGNCTMVCPTCFCATMEEVTAPGGEQSERWRKADSCFSIEFSHIYGGSIRQSPASRYRQWIVHKLATWEDQFGAPGCVGCGRCITWCPVGIDITAEARALRAAVERRAHPATAGVEREEAAA